MKTEEQIKARIAELYGKLNRTTDDAAHRRIEGNIGALEWVLRPFEHPLIDHFDGDGKPVYK